MPEVTKLVIGEGPEKPKGWRIHGTLVYKDWRQTPTDEWCQKLHDVGVGHAPIDSDEITEESEVFAVYGVYVVGEDEEKLLTQAQLDQATMLLASIACLLAKPAKLTIEKVFESYLVLLPKGSG